MQTFSNSVTDIDELSWCNPSDDGDFKRDLSVILPPRHIINNDSPGSIGGAGTPLPGDRLGTDYPLPGAT